jgi:autotransporter-associated beta strand protein
VYWTDSASQPAVFFPGDAVRFDDSAAITAIELAGTLAPASVTVDASVPYTISGGAIGGSASLTKSGSGDLTVSSALQATGPVTVAGGTLVIATSAAWPAVAPLIEAQSGTTLDVSQLATGATIAADQTLRGGGAVTGNVSISGNHDPAPGASIAGNLGYASSARVFWALNANATGGGAFDTISAGAVTIAAGALLELVFDVPGSTVDFSQPFWAAARSWTILTAGTRAGMFTLATPGSDPQSQSPATLGTFSLVAAGTALVLTWVPTPIIAIWQGSTSSDWDHTTPNWWRTGSAAIFQDGFTALLDDSAASTAINLVATVAPAALIVDSTKNYTISGGGIITGAATLEKKRSGTLTLATAHGFTGGTTISAGTVAIGDAGSLGTGPITLTGGALATGALTPLNSIVVTAASTISGGSGGGLQGIKAVSGSGTLTLNATNVFDLEGSLAGFAGRVYLSGTSTVRLNGCTGSALATFDLGTRTLTARTGTSFNLGALAGLAGSVLQGSSGSGNTSAVTYTIGANSTDSVFAGAITNGAGATSIIKAGSGTLTLSGSNTYTGNTTVNFGSLSVTGSLATTPVTVNSAASLTGTGTLAGAVKLSGTLAPGPGPGTLRLASLEMSPSAALQLEVGRACDRIITSGNLSLSGSLRVSVAPDTIFGRFPLILHGGVRTGSIALAGLAPGTAAHLSTATPGEVTLFLDDSDEDGLPDSWEQSNFGSLTSAPGDDPDGDGTNNLTEFRLGLKPTDGSSAFTATGARLPGGFTVSWPSVPDAVFEIQRSTSVSGPWTLLNKVVGTGTYTDPAPPPGRAFYRVALVP